MAFEGFCPSPPSPSPHSPYYQLLERGSARLGHVKNFKERQSYTPSNFEVKKKSAQSQVIQAKKLARVQLLAKAELWGL